MMRFEQFDPPTVRTDGNAAVIIKPSLGTGAIGPAGPGVPAGGTTGQSLVKNSNTDYDTEWATGGGGTGDPNAAVYGINVKNPDYGAVGDGTNDDTAEIQAAIDAAGSVAGGATAFFPAGIYKISAPLVVPSGVYLLGAGMGNTIIRAAASSSMDAMLTTATDQLNWIMTITDIQLDGNRTNSAAVDNAILWFGASDSSIERVRVVQVAGNGINITGSDIPLLGTAVTLDDVRIRGCDAIGIRNDVFSTDTAIVNCDVGQCDDHAIYLAGSNSSVTATRAWGSLTGLYVAGQIIRVSGGSRFDFNQLNGLVIAGDEVQVSATQVHSNSVAADGVNAGIEVVTGAGRVQIVGVRSWNSDIPDAGVQSYGLKLASGRVGPAFVLSCDFDGNDLGEIDHTPVAGDVVAPGVASTTREGVLRLSTGAEAIALSDPNSAISPDTLNDALVALDYATDTALDAHINDTTDAHDASAISFSPTGTIAATDVQAAVSEVASEAAAAYQPIDADLTAIAGLSPTNDDVIQRKAGSWVNRTMAQLKVDLAIAWADISGAVSAVNALIATAIGTERTAVATYTNKDLSSGTNTFPTLNQNTTGSAATLTTSRTIGTLTGDVTSAGSGFNGSANNTNATVLATVNSNVGSFGSASAVGTFTVNGKGLVTAAGTTSIALAGSAITSGTVDPARLGSGSSITTKFLRGDSTWQTVGGGGDMTAAIYDPQGIGEDAFLRSNHTGTQPLSSISDVTASATEVNFTDGVTSAIQTQLDAKAPLVSPSFTTPVLGTPTSGNLANCTFPTLNQNTTGSAAKWTTARTVALTGDVTYSQSVDGSANVTGAATLATVNSNVGSFGSATQVPTYTVNAKGLTTAASNTPIAIPSTAVTDFSTAADARIAAKWFKSVLVSDVALVGNGSENIIRQATIPANTLAAGSVLQITMYISALTGVTALTPRLRLGAAGTTADLQVGNGANTTVTPLLNHSVKVTFTYTQRVAGGAGTATANCNVEMLAGNSAVAVGQQIPLPTATAATLDTTVQNIVSVTLSQATATASVTQCVIEVLP